MEVDTAGDAPTMQSIAATRPQMTLWRLALALVLLQALVAALALWPFISGERYFAYFDIASDTYAQFSGLAMNFARLFGREGWTGWSFNIGLGAPIAFAFVDVFRFLTQVAGPEHVLALRIWVYLLKIALGGLFFLLLARQLVERKEAALIMALAYSFCGYMVVNGVWDSETNAFVFFPLVLWGVLRYLRNGDVLSFPLALGAATLSGVFFVSVAVSLAVAFAACVALSTQRRAMAWAWVTGILPLSLLGLLLGAPTALPMLLQLLDSPRVAGPDALLARMAGDALRLTDPGLAIQQLSALFHKDLLGSANLYSGYMNYLEGPGFYVGLLPLLLLPQLWTSGASDRRALVVGLIGIGLYMLVPAFRLAAFGFAVPYFRVTNLWVTLALLLLGLRALDRALLRLDTRMVLVGIGAVGGLLALLAWVLQEVVWSAHVWKLTVLLALWALLLCAATLGRLQASRLATLVLALTATEAVVVSWTSYLAGRPTAGPGAEPFKDQTLDALAAIRKADPGVYRIEKTFISASQTDAAAQDYLGVRSYYYHGSAAFDFYRSMEMLPNFGSVPPVNFTNWLDGPNDRAVLHSVLGVKYVISKERFEWPGFVLAHSGPGWFAYRNELALPFGVVQTRQVIRDDLRMENVPARKRAWLRDLAMLNAVVLEAPMPAWGTRLDLAKIVDQPDVDLPSNYVRPALELQRTGLQIDRFTHDRITGRITPAERGILVFSIPDYRGWTLQLDGQPAPLMRANFGLIATPVTAGAHRVELKYELPGLRAGFLLAVAAALALAVALVLRGQRTAR